MHEVDMADAVRWMTTRWNSAKSVWSNSEALMGDFRPYSAGAMRETLSNYYREGNDRPPTPSKLLNLLSATQVRRYERGVDPKPDVACTEHLFADPLPFEEDRHRVCVRCDHRGGLVKCDHHFNPQARCVYCLETV